MLGKHPKVTLVLGIDEAGRGPVIGPMIIGGFMDTERSGISYKEMGCKDSKLLSPQKRQELKAKIEKTAKEFHYISISAEEIDSLRKIMSLNEIEAKKMAELILSFENKPDKIIIDCPDTEPSRFLQRMRKYMGPDFEAIIEHKADENYPIVSCASIIAKTERDDKIKEMEKVYGVMGSGYPADPKTKDFLKNFYAEHGKLPPIVRKSWDTIKRLENSKLQSKLDDY